MFGFPRFLLVLLVLVLLSRLLLLYIDTHYSHRFTIQQDNYANYAYALRHNSLHSHSLSPFDTRLFPGYPVLIAAVASIVPVPEVTIGVAISIISCILAAVLFWNWTKQVWATWLFAFFPPVWLQSNVKVATEPLTVFLLLLSTWLFQKRRFFLTGLVLGYACTVRNIAVFLFLNFVILMVRRGLKQEGKHLLALTASFTLPLIGLLIFNLIFWHHPLYQFLTYGSYSKMMFGVAAFFTSAAKNIQHHEHRILLSSAFYLVFTFWGAVGLGWGFIKKRSIYTLALLWGLLSLTFLFTVSFSSFLEDFGRYTIPFLPATILGITAFDYTQIMRKRK